MAFYGDDIFTEPEIDDDVLGHLGPLRALVGEWRGERGTDVHPVADGAETQRYVERYLTEVLEPQPNGPQLLYGLRYHAAITKPDEDEMFHDQVGYWLYEPATSTVLHTVSIPRGQVALAVGHADADATSFTVLAQRGATTNGIASNEFLDAMFTTVSFSCTVTVYPDATWGYEEDTVLLVHGRQEFHHTDAHRLHRVG